MIKHILKLTAVKSYKNFNFLVLHNFIGLHDCKYQLQMFGLPDMLEHIS